MTRRDKIQRVIDYAHFAMWRWPKSAIAFHATVMRLRGYTYRDIAEKFGVSEERAQELNRIGSAKLARRFTL